MEEQRPVRAIPACLFAWLIPGAGHFYLGKRGRGILFFLTLTTLFTVGVLMEARLQAPPRLFDDPLGTFFEDPLGVFSSAMQPAIGLAYIVARHLAVRAGNIYSVTFEYGNTFTAIGGLLNVLVILDAYDIALGRRT